jgi:5-methyltetrahydropteroyltriglutamate--homocysteine methyltransferase
MTIVDTIADAHFGDKAALAMAFAELLNEEARELAEIGVDVVQFNEPAFNVYMEEVTERGIAALQRAAQDLPCKTAVHICYGYGISSSASPQTLGPCVISVI